MSEPLKPCPFCGGKAKIHMEHKRIGLTLWGRCEKCLAETVDIVPKMTWKVLKNAKSWRLKHGTDGQRVRNRRKKKPSTWGKEREWKLYI